MASKEHDEKMKKYVENYFADEEMNELARHELLDEANLEKWAKAITNFCIRIGPVEEFYDDRFNLNKLSDDDLEVVRKYLLSRVAAILMLIQQEQFLLLENLLDFHTSFNSDDNAINEKVYNCEVELAVKHTIHKLEQLPEFQEESK